MPISATKLYIPSPQSQVVLRSRLNEQLNEGLHRKLTFISTPAGFGKATLISEWISCRGAVTAPLHVAQPPPTESILLFNEITTILDDFIFVFDDYQVIDAEPIDASLSVDDALAFLIEPPPLLERQALFFEQRMCICTMYSFH